MNKMHQCNSCAFNTVSTIKPLREDILQSTYVIALAGNPNTGKSTLFNALTGLRQHTGNWSGKTVTRAQGGFSFNGQKYKLIDLPGTYSLLSTSEDEEVARNYILFSKPDVTVVVVDATRIERNLNLTLQILQITSRVVVCLNLLDEARRNGINIDIRALSRKLGVPVVGVSARSKQGISELVQTIEEVARIKKHFNLFQISAFPKQIEQAIQEIEYSLKKDFPKLNNARWIAMRLLEEDDFLYKMLRGNDLEQGNFSEKTNKIISYWQKELGQIHIHSYLLEGIYKQASNIVQGVVFQDGEKIKKDWSSRIDSIVTSRIWGFPIMFFILVVVLWITIIGANYPSALLNEWLVVKGHNVLNNLLDSFGVNDWLSGFFVDGIYLATAWVISVMLPPMAIFFPIFTLLEDFGYLPRVAFNLDNLFRKSGGHGKQALTMTMGFGCNASGVVSTRIIDSKRERLIAIITNNFSLCNGRWPTQILLASVFLGTLVPYYLSGVVAIMAVSGVALLGIGLMFIVSWLLSKTMLKGEVSTFHLELPPYRPPQFWQTIYTSLIDRTLIVLWRAVIFAIPAGAVIWLISNISVGDTSLAGYMVNWFDGVGIFFGLNGIILLAYIVAIPANEIVMPTILMLIAMLVGIPEVSAGDGVLFELDSYSQIGEILRAGGWTTLTAVNVMLFSLLHNPCSTTIYTIYKETQSVKWTMVATFLPILIGLILLMITTQIFG